MIGFECGLTSCSSLSQLFYLIFIIIMSTQMITTLSKQTPCVFNKLCFCSDESQLREITCSGVPMAHMPHIPASTHYYRVRIRGSRDIRVLNNNSFQNVTISSLTLSRSKLSEIESLAFSGMESTLTTLDLSHNSIREFPAIPLSRLKQIQWLSLRGNKIEVLNSRDFKDIISLRSLILSENKLSSVQDQTFRDLVNLEYLDLDANLISRIEGNPFPSGLITLSMANCIAHEIPSHAISYLNNIKSLQLRGNLIRQASKVRLLSNTRATQEHIEIEMLDLSHNLISSFPSDVFMTTQEGASIGNPLVGENRNRSETRSWRREERNIYEGNSNVNNISSHSHSILLHIRDLHLDFNFIQSLASQAFRQISVERLSLSNNRITSELIAGDAFVGPMETDLRALDLNYNLMDVFPRALTLLRGLKQLLLKNNKLQDIDEEALSNYKDLEVLDVSKNALTSMPSKAFKSLKRLLKLNLQDNFITAINEDDFGLWSSSLLSLSLTKNNIKTISGDIFKHAKNLRELRLAGNDLLYVQNNILVPLGKLELLDVSYSLNSANARHLIQTSATHSHSYSDSDVLLSLNLRWLQLAYTKLQHIPSMRRLPSLWHLDMEGNLITSLENNFLANNLNMSSVILDRNLLMIIESNTFSNLDQLETISIQQNQRLKKIENKAFNNLFKLKTLLLSSNQISQIENGAFYNLSSGCSSLHVLLDDNILDCFSLAFFEGMTGNNEVTVDGEGMMLYINVSHNEISQLQASYCSPSSSPSTSSFTSLSSQSKPLTNEISNSTPNSDQLDDDYRLRQTLNVRVLDISFNRISHLLPEFMDTICPSLQVLHLEHNKLSHMPVSSLKACNELQILILDHNNISEQNSTIVDESKNENANMNSKVNETVIACCSNLQILSLKHNKIHSLYHLESVFKGMKNLRVLDISDNLISSMPENAFDGTKLERLRLVRNKLHQSKIAEKHTKHANCFAVKTTLLYLDLSHNNIDQVPFHLTSCEHLIELNLAHNMISEVNEHSFSAFHKLLELDLSHNPIKEIDSKAFFGITNCNTLKLQNISLMNVPILILPHLIYLDLSDNMIASLSSSSFTKTRQLRYLDLSKNLLTDVPRYIWRYMTELHALNIAYNPIDILDTSSFVDLKRLHHLDIRGLTLQYIDMRLLHNHKYIISIKTSTYPQVRSFRLHDLLSKSVSLKSALIDVSESTLSHQIQWAFGTKLKELIITGSNLNTILPDAFLGFHQTHDLTLRVTNTNVTNLPNGMFRYLSGIRLTIDLRKNKLKTFQPEVLFTTSSLNDNFSHDMTSSSYEKLHLQQINLVGGLLLDDNPLKCDCSLLWISDWLARWISDMRIINIEAAAQAQSVAKHSTCFYPASASHIKGNINIYTDSIKDTLKANHQRRSKLHSISLLDLRKNGMMMSTCKSKCETMVPNFTVNFILIFVCIILSNT